MANTLKFYTDAALSNELAGGFPLYREVGGADADGVLYLGSVASSRQFVAEDGGDIIVSIADAQPGAGDFESADILLASSQAGLDAAVPGADLNLGAQLLSGSANAAAVWVRFAGVSATPVKSSEISLQTNLTLEFPQ